jgi:hypothetical protein
MKVNNYTLAAALVAAALVMYVSVFFKVGG